MPDNLLYLQKIMAKFLKYIGFLLVMLALWQTTGEVLAEVSTTSNDKPVYMQDVTYSQQEDLCFTTPQLPLLPEAELTGASICLQTLTAPRLQRAHLAEYLISLKNWTDRISRYESTCQVRREKQYDAAAFHHCQPPCDYYIFTLRRILI